MKKSIYYHIDEYNRDTIVAASLYKKLSNKYNFFFGNRIDEGNLKKLDSFDIYIFPTVERLKNAFGEPKNCKGKIFILPNESISGSIKVKRRLELHLTGTISNSKLKNKWLERVNFFFLWGNSHLKVLKNYSRKLSKKSLIVGHPRHDKICYKKNIIKNQNFSLGMVSRFDTINMFDNRLNFENIYNGWIDQFEFKYLFDSKANVEHQWFNSVLDFRFFLDIIRLLNKKKIIPEIRPHPRENRNNWLKFIKKFNLNVKISKFDETFVDWLNRQDLIISSASTSLYDCVLLDKNVIVIDKLSKEREKHGNIFLDDFDPIIKNFKRPVSLIELEKILYKNNKAKKSKSLKKLLYIEVNFPNHINSIAKISNYIIKNELNEKEFIFSEWFKQETFKLLQNYYALKLSIKFFFGFKEVGSIFSLGFTRQKKIKNFLKND